MKAYGIDLLTCRNFEKITSTEFIHKVNRMDGFIALAPYGGGAECNFYNSPTVAILFDSASNRNKAYRKLSEEMECAVILETGEIDARYARKRK